MNIKIGFQHNKNSINLYFNGKYKVFDGNEEKISEFENAPLILELFNSKPAEYDWYEKLDTFYDVSKMESYQEKYFYKHSKVRIVRVGVEIGKFDNFEYWVLKKSQNMDGKSIWRFSI
jgi:hypothetical protein